MLMAQPAVRATDLVDNMAGGPKGAREPRAVRACPLDAEGADGAQGLRPDLKFTVAFPTDSDRQLCYAGPEPRDRYGGVGVLVGIDADDDVGG